MRGDVKGRRVHAVVVPPRVAKRHTVNLKICAEVTRREHYDVRQRMSNHRRLKPLLPVKTPPNHAES